MLMVRLHYVLRFILIYYSLYDVIVNVLFIYQCWFVFVLLSCYFQVGVLVSVLFTLGFLGNFVLFCRCLWVVMFRGGVW